MANRIKGITVEIGGDTAGLDKALKGVNSTIKSTQSSLRDVNRLLKLDPSNAKLLAQKQQLLQKEISETSEKLNALKEADKQAKVQLENGELGQDKYEEYTKLGCVGGEDWQWEVFTNNHTTPIDSTCENAKKWLELMR